MSAFNPQLLLLDGMGNILVWFFSGSLLFGIISYFVGEQKGNGCLGCILGLLIGPFGLLVTVLLGRNKA